MTDTGQIERTVMLKQVVFKKGNRKDFTVTPMHELIDEVFTKSPAVSQRHVPSLPLNPSQPKPKRCTFIDTPTQGRVVPNGLGFRFCSYQQGRIPESMPPRFDEQNASIEAIPLTDAESGKNREMPGTAMVIAWNQIMAVEASQNTGGIAYLEKCLSDLVKRYVDPKHPSVHLIDVPESALLQMLRRGGGAAELVMDIEKPKGDAEGKYSRRMSEMLRNGKKRTKGTKLMRVSLVAGKNEVVDEDAILDAFSEHEDEELDQVRVKLRAGGTIVGLNKCRVARRVGVRELHGGNRDELSMLAAMSDWLCQLQIPVDGVRTITDDGRLADR